MLTEELQIFKDTQNLCKMLLQYQADIPKCIKFGEYGNAITYSFNIINDLHSISLTKDAAANIRWLAWNDINDKHQIMCVNMKKFKLL